MNKKVSIIVPIYNTSKYLSKCLASIANQTYQNLEIILVDDGSTDTSGQIADKFAKQDPRFVVIHQTNQGQSVARNTGLKRSTGDFISFIDSDDEIKPTFIANLLDAYTEDTSLTVCGMLYKRLHQHTAENVYIDYLRPQKNHETKKSYFLYLLATDGRLYSSVNKLYRGEFARKCTFDRRLQFAEDTKFVLDYLQKTPGHINFVLKPLYVYNFGTTTSTIKSTSVNWQNWQIAYHNLKKWLGPHPTFREKFWLHLVHLRWHISFFRSLRRAKNSN